MLEEHFHGGCPRLPGPFGCKCPGCEHPGLGIKYLIMYYMATWASLIRVTTAQRNQGIWMFIFQGRENMRKLPKVLEMGIAKEICLQQKENLDF